MRHSKKKKEGYAERMAILNRVLPGSDEISAAVLSRYLRKNVARDDIADALVAVATAMYPVNTLCTIPTTPESDSQELPMEMVYPGITEHHVSNNA